METEGYSPPEVSSGEVTPEIVETTPEAIEAPSLGESIEPDLVPEPEEVPPWTPETETGPSRNKESLPEKQGDLIKPTGDPRDSAAAEDQALLDEVQRMRDEQEKELAEDVKAFDDRPKPPYVE